MAKSNSNKLAFALLDLYLTLYKEKYGRSCSINKFRDKWAMIDIIDSVGYDRSIELLEYYFKTNNPNHSLSWFFYNFDRLDEMMKRLNQDAAWRAKVRQETKNRMESD